MYRGGGRAWQNFINLITSRSPWSVSISEPTACRKREPIASRSLFEPCSFAISSQGVVHLIVPVGNLSAGALAPFKLVKAFGVLPRSADASALLADTIRSEENTSELQSLMRISYAVFCLNKKQNNITYTQC